MTLAKTVIATY